MEATRRVGGSPAMRGIPSVVYDYLRENDGQWSLFDGRSKPFMGGEDSVVGGARSCNTTILFVWFLEFIESLSRSVYSKMS